MKTSQIDWRKLKQDYVRGTINSVTSFLKNEGIKMSGYVSRKTKGWKKEQDLFLKRLEEVTQDKVLEKVSESESEVRARQAKYARFLQEQGIKALEKIDENGNLILKPQTPEEARRFVADGLVQEREALGINKSQTAIGVNFDIKTLPIMSTHYGKALLGMNYDQLIGVLLRLKELDKQQPKI